MRIGPFGHWEIILILVVVMLLFGAKRLPDMAKGIGQSIREFRRGIRGLDEPDESPASANAEAPAAAGSAPFVAVAAEPVDRR